MTETSPSGNDFMSTVVNDWEAATEPLASVMRVCCARFGMVLHPNGGVMKRLQPLMKAGLLGNIGDGSQFVSWISLDDAVRSIYTLIAQSTASGPINIVSPVSQTQHDWIRDWGRAMFRPTRVPLPKFAVQQIMGEMGESLLLRSSKILPTWLMNEHFKFQCLSMQDVCNLYYP